MFADSSCSNSASIADLRAKSAGLALQYFGSVSGLTCNFTRNVVRVPNSSLNRSELRVMSYSKVIDSEACRSKCMYFLF